MWVNVSNLKAAKLAAKNGCKPFSWAPYDGAYCCGCDDNRHACDQQCSIIDMDSARRKPRQGRRGGNVLHRP